MGLMDEIKQEHESRRANPRCGIASLLSSLPEDEANDLVSAMSGEWTAVAIANALTNRGHRIGYQIVQRHRRGACGCPR
jgi:hypothetical protein